MQRLIDKGLEELTAIIFRMGKVAEKTVATSVNGYLSGKDTSKDVRELSEILVANTAEVEEKAFSLIARYQPVASDLRIINSYMKIAYDFERYGRYGWDISYVTKKFSGKTTCDPWIIEYMDKMGESALNMVAISINSLRKLDIELVKTVTKTEDDVDNMYFAFLDKLVEEGKVTNECTVSSLLVVRYLERIADHAMHIMEAVVYITSGDKVTLR